MRFAAKRPLGISSLATSASLAAAAVVFGISRSPEMFFLGVCVLPSLMIASLICVAAAALRHKGDHLVLISAVLVLLAPIAAYVAVHSRDRARFIGWAMTHPATLTSAARKDSIITEWDSWGIAGLENESYLISDIFDDSSDVDSAERWRTRMDIKCPIAATARMQKNIYIITIFNCSIEVDGSK